MVNIEKLVLKALQDADLDAYVRIPTPPPDPVMRVNYDGVFGPSSQMPDWLYEFDVECQTWGTTETLASTLVEAANQVLRGQPSNLHGAVTRIQMVSNQNLPDTETLVDGQPSPRYITRFRIHAHP